MRILSITFHASHDLQRILSDAATPPNDKVDFLRALCTVCDEYDPRTHLDQVLEQPQLLEWCYVARSSGHRYGVFLVDMGVAADAIACWRDPPLLLDPHTPWAHGSSRAHALVRATERLKDLR